MKSAIENVASIPLKRNKKYEAFLTLFTLAIQRCGREIWVITSSEPCEQGETYFPATKSRLGQLG